MKIDTWKNAKRPEKIIVYLSIVLILVALVMVIYFGLIKPDMFAMVMGGVVAMFAMVMSQNAEISIKTRMLTEALAKLTKTSSSGKTGVNS